MSEIIVATSTRKEGNSRGGILEKIGWLNKTYPATNSSEQNSNVLVLLLPPLTSWPTGHDDLGGTIQYDFTFSTFVGNASF